MKKMLFVSLIALFSFHAVFAGENEKQIASAVKAIEKIGGVVSYDMEKPGNPVIEVNFNFEPALKDEDLVHLKPLRKLSSLFFEQTGITSKGLLQLDGFSHLERLDLIKTKIDDEALRWVAKNRELRILGLNGTNVTNAGLSHISGLTKLEGLLLSETKVTDVGLAHLKGMKGLKRLYLEKTAVTNDGVAKLKDALPDLWVSR